MLTRVVYKHGNSGIWHPDLALRLENLRLDLKNKGDFNKQHLEKITLTIIVVQKESAQKATNKTTPRGEPDTLTALHEETWDRQVNWILNARRV